MANKVINMANNDTISIQNEIMECYDSAYFLPEHPKYFSDCKHVKKIFIECRGWKDSETNSYVIPSSMFEGYSSLEVIEFRNSNNIRFTEIGDKAFKGCKSLLYIGFGSENFAANNLCKIGNEAFSGCRKLLLFPGVDTSKNIIIGDRAFQECVSLQNIDISASKKKVIRLSIGTEAFQYCRGLTHVCISNAVINKIGKAAFGQCIKLKTLNVTSSKINSIGDGAFECCEKLTEVFLVLMEPENDTKVLIGEKAFATCSSLCKVDITVINNDINSINSNISKDVESSHVITFGEHAFHQPNGKKTALSSFSITITCCETSVETLFFEQSVFHGCKSLSHIKILFPENKTPRGCYLIFRPYALYQCNDVSIMSKKFSETFEQKEDTSVPHYYKYDGITFSKDVVMDESGARK